MNQRALDKNHDWIWGHNVNDYLTGINAVRQDIETRLLSFVGDCFFDISAGLDYANFIGGKNNQSTINLAASTVIANTDNVTAVNNVSLNYNSTTRSITLVYSATTAFTLPSGQAQVIANTTNFLLTESGFILDTEGNLGIVAEG